MLILVAKGATHKVPMVLVKYAFSPIIDPWLEGIANVKNIVVQNCCLFVENFFSAKTLYSELRPE